MDHFPPNILPKPLRYHTATISRDGSAVECKKCFYSMKTKILTPVFSHEKAQIFLPQMVIGQEPRAILLGLRNACSELQPSLSTL